MRCAGAIDPCPNCVDYKVLRDSPARNSPKTSAETPDPILGSPGASVFFRKGTDIMGLSRGKAEKLVLWYLRLAPGCHSSPYKARDFWAVLVKLSFEINLENFGLNPFVRWGPFGVIGICGMGKRTYICNPCLPVPTDVSIFIWPRCSSPGELISGCRIMIYSIEPRCLEGVEFLQLVGLRFF